MPPRGRLCAVALAAALACAPWAGRAAEPASPAAQLSAYHVYDIAPGSLSRVLSEFAGASGVVLSADAGLTDGRKSPGLRGRYTVRQGFERLLAETGLEVVSGAGGIFTVRRLPASAGAAPDPVRLGPVTVTASTPRDAVYETPGSVAVVTREDIDRLPPRNTSDVLADVPGVHTSQTRQNPGVVVNIRGLQGFGRVNVMIDGARQNYQQSGHGDSGQVYLDAELLGQVDISKGPSSTVGGAGMIAGQVNFRTLIIDDLVDAGKSYGGRVNATTGSNGYNFAGSVAGGWRLDEQWDLVAAVSRKRVGEFERGSRNVDDTLGPRSGTAADWQIEQARNNVSHVSRLTSQDQTSGLVKLGWRLDGQHQFRLGYVGFKADFGEGSGSANGLGIESRNAVRTHTVTLDHRWTPGSRWFQTDSKLYFTKTSNDSDRDAVPGADIGWSRMHFETNTVGGSLENRARFSFGGFDAVWRAGGEFYHDWTRPGAVAQETGADRGDPQVMLGGTPKGQRTVASLFNELALMKGDWLEVAGGLRYDWFGMKGDGLMRVGRIYNGPGGRPVYSTLYTEFETDRHASVVSPSLRIAVKPIAPLQLFASYGRGMRPPSITESFRYGSHPGSVSFPYYPNPGLDAERSRNWEIGANLMLRDLVAARDRLNLKAAWFDSKVDNYMVLAAVMAPNSTSGGISMNSPMSFVNLKDPFRSKGLELQADYDAGTVFASASYARAIIDTGAGRYDPFPLGSQVGYPPTDLGNGAGANIWYVLPPVKKFSLSGGVRLFDQRLVLGARMRYESPATNRSAWIGNSYSRPYHVYDAWASLAVTKQVTLRLSVQNLLDENYAEMNGVSYWIAPGRTVLASMSVRF